MLHTANVCGKKACLASTTLKTKPKNVVEFGAVEIKVKIELKLKYFLKLPSYQ